LLSLDDFSAGSLFASFEYSGEATITLDVTPFIQGLVSSKHDFAGFNFQFAVPTAIPMNGPFVAFNSLEYPLAANLIIITCPACQGDFDQDGDVDGSDLAVFATDFMRTDCSGDCEGNFDNNGDVDGSDPAVFAADFGRTDCPGALSMDLQWDLTIGSSCLAIWMKNSFPCMYLDCLLL